VTQLNTKKSLKVASSSIIVAWGDIFYYQGTRTRDKTESKSWGYGCSWADLSTVSRNLRGDTAQVSGFGILT
jgi:hypothetical protein